MYKEIDTEAEAKTITQDIQNRYLSFGQHFLKDGILDLALLVRNNVERVLKNYDLKQKLDLADVEQIFYSIQTAVMSEIESNENKSLAKIFLPSEKSQQDSEIMRKMLLETIDMLETEEVLSIVSQHVGQGFSTTTDEIANFFTVPQATPVAQEEVATAAASNNSSFNNINKVQIALAKLIPIINGLCPKSLNGKGLPNNLINLLVTSEKIKMLGANTYEVFSQ